MLSRTQITPPASERNVGCLAWLIWCGAIPLTLLFAIAQFEAVGRSVDEANWEPVTAIDPWISFVTTSSTREGHLGRQQVVERKTYTVRYSYQVDGVTHTSSVWDSSGGSPTEADATAAKRDHRLQVYVDPADPTRCVAFRRSPARAWTQLIAAWVAVALLVVLAFRMRRKRRGARSAPPPKRR